MNSVGHQESTIIEYQRHLNQLNTQRRVSETAWVGRAFGKVEANLPQSELIDLVQASVNHPYHPLSERERMTH